MGGGFDNRAPDPHPRPAELIHWNQGPVSPDPGTSAEVFMPSLFGRAWVMPRARGRTRVLLGVAVSSSLAGVASPSWGQQTAPQVVEFLQQSIGLDSNELKMVESGKAVVKILDTKEKRDVAVFGIITVNVSRPVYIARVTDFSQWLQSADRPQFGLFSNPAKRADVEAATIDSGDLKELKNCQPGSCKVKLPAVAMQQFREKISWSAPDAAAQVNAYSRQLMVQYVTDYRARGDSALVTYDDHGNVRASDALSALVAQSSFVYKYSEPLHSYLANYPHGKLDGVSDVLYWSVDAMSGLRPILSINHTSVYAPPEVSGVTVIAGKQIYANHYFEATLDLLMAADRPTPTGKPGIYLIVLRRYRFDNLPSGGIANIRGKVLGKLRDKTRSDLEREKAASEH